MRIRIGSLEHIVQPDPAMWVEGKKEKRRENGKKRRAGRKHENILATYDSKESFQRNPLRRR